MISFDHGHRFSTHYAHAWTWCLSVMLSLPRLGYMHFLHIELTPSKGKRGHMTHFKVTEVGVTDFSTEEGYL